MPYSPLGRGFLTGTITTTADLADDDFRRVQPRFTAEALADNGAAVSVIREIAAAHDATPGQVALAWVLAQGDDVVPIPGTKRVTYVEENAGAGHIELGAQDLARLDAITVRGPRSADPGWINRSTPT